MSAWIKTSDRLPEDGKYVLARHGRGTWFDDDDQDNVNCVVVKLVRGISMKERASMSGDRANSFRAEDEDGNNLRPYFWNQFGPDSFFGQDIIEWMPIPSANDNQ